jgi:hypothetical protein
MIKAEARTVAQCIDEAAVLLVEALNAKSEEEQRRLLARMMLWADAARTVAIHNGATASAAI